jgi:hypothetical protein
MIVTSITSLASTLTLNPTFFGAVKIFGAIIARLIAISSHTKVESLASILIP